jgi:NarL family two-component system response regulator LiaR
MNENKPIRVVSVDDHELVRQGIRSSLRPFSDLEFVGEAANGNDALVLCADANPDIVLMDVYLAGELDGIATTRAIIESFPQIKIVALSTFFDRKLVQSMMKAGAKGYLVKAISGEEMAEAIRAVHAGRPALATEAVDALVQLDEFEPKPGHDLTAREREVLALLVAGFSNPEIALQLNVSVAGVKYHVSNILSKLGVSNRNEATALARQHGLTSPPGEG